MSIQDWIEDLFAKSELKDEKIRQACEARNDAMNKCEMLENEMTKTKELLEYTISDLERSTIEKEKLRRENEEAAIRIESMTTEIHSLKSQLNSESDTTERFEALNMELAHIKEECKTAQIALNQVTAEKNYLLKIEQKSTETIEELKMELSQGKEECTTAQNALSEVTTEKERLLRSEHDAAIKLNMLESEIRGLKPERTEFAKTAFLKSQLADDSEMMQRHNLGDLEREKKEDFDLRDTNEMLEKQAEEYHSKIEHLERTLQDLAYEHAAEKRVLLHQIEQYEEELSHAEAALKFSAKSNDIATERIEMLENEAEKAKSEILRLEAQGRKLSDTALQDVESSLLNEIEREKKDASNVRETNEELKRETKELAPKVEANKDFACQYAEEKKMLLEKIELIEEELSHAQAALKSKSEELDHIILSLDSEKEKNSREKAELLERLNKADQSTSSHDKSQSIYRAKRQFSKIDGDSGMELQRVRRECDNLKTENLRLKAERRYLSEFMDKTAMAGDDRQELETARKMSEELSNKLHGVSLQLESAKLQRRKSEKALVEKDKEMKEIIAQLQDTQKQLNFLQRENVSLEAKKTEICESLSKIRGLVDALSSENIDLKEKNENFERTNAYLESRA